MTAQVRDVLKYNGEKLYMAAEPLEDYLKKINLPHKLVAPNTACWRGYDAKWAIDNKKLFLTDWKGYILDYQEVGIDFLFPGEEFVFANWFSGIIRVPIGEQVIYVHGGYGSVYEGDMFLEFKDGMLVNEHSKWLTKEEIEKIKAESKMLDDLF